MADRRPLRFWQPFNDWWRAELDKQGRRPTASEIVCWYNDNAHKIWGADNLPSIQETRIHAKCLRSNQAVREYFREYRAKKRNQSNGTADGEDGDYYDEDAPALGRGGSLPNAPDAGFIAGTTPPLATLGLFSGGCLPPPGLTGAWPARNPLSTPLVDHMQQQELVRNFMVLQAQHTMALQQQLALAALTQQYGASTGAIGALPNFAPLAVQPISLFDLAPGAPQQQVLQGAPAGLDLLAAGADIVAPQLRRASADDVGDRMAQASARMGHDGMHSAASWAATEPLGASPTHQLSTDGVDQQAHKRMRHTTSAVPEPQHVTVTTVPGDPQPVQPGGVVRSESMAEAPGPNSPSKLGGPPTSVMVKQEVPSPQPVQPLTPLPADAVQGRWEEAGAVHQDQGQRDAVHEAAAVDAAAVDAAEAQQPAQAEVAAEEAATKEEHVPHDQHSDHENYDHSHGDHHHHHHSHKHRDAFEYGPIEDQLAELKAMSHAQLVQEVLTLRHTLHMKTCTGPCCGHTKKQMALMAAIFGSAAGQ